MQTIRIELEGSAGHVAIERQRGSDNIRIDSILSDPKKEQGWMTWNIPASTGDDELFMIAETVQRRCDGVVGTSSMVHDYFREMQRFQD